MGFPACPQHHSIPEASADESADAFFALSGYNRLAMKLLRRWFTWPRAVAACALMPAILLGMWGFYIDLASSGRADIGSIWFWLSILYSTLQLFVMEFNVQNTAAPLPWQYLIRRPRYHQRPSSESFLTCSTRNKLRRFRNAYEG